MAAPDPITPVVYQNTFKGIPWSEHVPGSPEFNFASDAGRSTRQIIVPWAQLQAAVEAFLGYGVVGTAVTPTGTIRYLSRTIPHCHPAFPWLFAASIPRVEGLGSRKKERRAVPVELGQEASANDVALYDHALLTINYVSEEYEILPDSQVQSIQTDGLSSVALPDDALLKRFITRICRPSGRTLTLHRGLMRWSDGTPIPEGLGKVIPTLQLTYIWHYVPRESVPFKAIQSQLGTVNNAPFDVDVWNFPAGTVLFDAVDFRPCMTPKQTPPYRRCLDVQMTFRFQGLLDKWTDPAHPVVRGWNYAHRVQLAPPAPDPAARSRLVPVELRSSWPDGNHPFEDSDFNLLFRPDQP